MTRPHIPWLPSLLFALVLPAGADAWNKAGHMVTGAIAYQALKEAGDEPHPQPEACGAARHDRGRAAEREGTAGNELLTLTEGKWGVERAEDDIWIGVPDDEQVEGVEHAASW